MTKHLLPGLLIFSIFSACSHSYIHSRVIQPLVTNEFWRQFWMYWYSGWWFLLTCGLFWLKHCPSRVKRALEVPYYGWMGFAYMQLVTCLLSAPLNHALEAVQPGHESTIAWGVWVASCYLFVHGLACAFGREQIIEETLEFSISRGFRRMPRSSDAPGHVRVVALTDIHAGTFVTRRRLEKLKNRVNALQPDVICVVGDLVYGRVSQLESTLEPLAGLKSRFGTFYVTGNHEYYSGADAWRRFASEKLGWQSLQNAACCLTLEGGRGRLWMVGIEDRTFLRSSKSQRRWRRRLLSLSKQRRLISRHLPDPRFDAAFRPFRQNKEAADGKQPGDVVVLLAHQPRDARRLWMHPEVDLQISGHTHAGQLWPLNWFAKREQGFLKGLYRLGHQALYVSQGAGFGVPPLRLGTRSEITVLHLWHAAWASSVTTMEESSSQMQRSRVGEEHLSPT